MMEDSRTLRKSLRDLGVSHQAIEAVWPSWWSDDAERSRSAQVELRFTVARRLGLAPKSLFDQETPTFVWRHEAKFKGISALDDTERAALTSFGIALARLLVRATPEPKAHSLFDLTAADIRASILRKSAFVALPDLTAVCWGLGIPVIHLRVFPLSAKRMHAMAVRVENRFAVLIGKDANYPAPTAYHLAHEMGHVIQGHLQSAGAIVDFDEPIEMAERDAEETEADAFALQLLTGHSKPSIKMNAMAGNPTELARAVASAAPQYGIEPGTLALCYGHQTGDWPVAYASLKRIYPQRAEVWRFLNRIALDQMDLSALTDGNVDYLRAVLGAPEVD